MLANTISCVHCTSRIFSLRAESVLHHHLTSHHRYWFESTSNILEYYNLICIKCVTRLVKWKMRQVSGQRHKVKAGKYLNALRTLWPCSWLVPKKTNILCPTHDAAVNLAVHITEQRWDSSGTCARAVDTVLPELPAGESVPVIYARLDMSTEVFPGAEALKTKHHPASLPVAKLSCIFAQLHIKICVP